MTNPHFRQRLLSATLAAALAGPAMTPAWALDESGLAYLTLEDLLEIEVTSVAKKTQKLSESSAAVFVITQDDIRRSGAPNIPELLRMVPGVQVARINAYAHAVAVRGFNSSFSNKLLVLVDGRSVYTPEFSGVYWDMIDMVLDDIERIEVIRGPGGTLWGANAVNGVINIITKNARDTHGTLLKAGAGDQDQEYRVAARHGGTVGADSKTSYRVYAKATKNHDFPFQQGESMNLPVRDGWYSNRGGFRLDSTPTDTDRFTLQADFFSAQVGRNEEACLEDYCEYVAAVDEEGINLLGRWERRYAEDSNIQVQVYADYMKREDLSLLSFIDKNLSLEFQHQFPLGGRHALLWGAGYRQVYNDRAFGLYHEFRPQTIQGDLFNLFVQGDIHLADNLRLTAGVKLEQHYYTGLEFQPNLRLLWQAAEQTSVWAAASRAVRTPSRFEYSSFVELPGFSRQGNSELDAEVLMSYELGWRQRFGPRFSVDASLFYNQYDKLMTIDNETRGDTDYGIIENGMEAEAYGLELSGNWFVTDSWHLHAAYSWLDLQAHLRPGIDTFDYAYDPATETRDPQHQLSLRSQTDLGRNWELDIWLRYVSALEQYADSAQGSGIDAHTDMDLRLAWKPRKNLELSLAGRNLLKSRHAEFGEEPILLYFRNDVPRSVYAQVKWSF